MTVRKQLMDENGNPVPGSYLLFGDPEDEVPEQIDDYTAEFQRYFQKLTSEADKRAGHPFMGMAASTHPAENLAAALVAGWQQQIAPIVACSIMLVFDCQLYFNSHGLVKRTFSLRERGHSRYHKELQNSCGAVVERSGMSQEALAKFMSVYTAKARAERQ